MLTYLDNGHMLFDMDAATHSAPTHTCRESWQRTAVRAMLRGDSKAFCDVLTGLTDVVADQVYLYAPEDAQECRKMARGELHSLANELCGDELVDEDAPGVHADMEALQAWVTAAAESCEEGLVDDVSELLGDGYARERDVYAYHGVSQSDFF
jgi:hypothetical protein